MNKLFEKQESDHRPNLDKFRRKPRLKRHFLGSSGISRLLQDAGFEPKEVNFVDLCSLFYPEKKPSDLTSLEQVKLIRYALRKRETFLIHPHSTFMKYFDLIICVALVFTGVVTPYEVIFMKTVHADSWLFFCNRLVDVVFLVDTILQFYVKVEISQPGKYGTVLLKDRKRIRRMYMRSWFPVDVVGLIPFDIVFIVYDGSETFSGVKILRCVRLLRLVKLVRILRTSRLILRWQSYYAISFASQKIAKFSLLLLMSSHWMACLWGFAGLTFGANLCDANGDRIIGDIPPKDTSWVTALFADESAPDSPCDPWHVYMASLHWSVMTITSIGYGDITPVRHAEYAVCVVCMLAGGVLWAYTIGCISSIMAHMDPVENHFEINTDLVNNMMRESGVSESKRQVYREYLRESKAYETMMHFREVASTFSPQLKGELLLYTCRSWTESVFYLEDAPERIMMALAHEMTVHFYSKKEELHQQCLCLVEQGTIASAGRILTPGDAFNIDCIVAEKRWRRFPRTVSLTYSMLLALDRAQLMEVGGREPSFRDTLKYAAAKIAIMRCMSMCAERGKQEQQNSVDGSVPGLQEVFSIITSEADAEQLEESGASMSMKSVIRATMMALSEESGGKPQPQRQPSMLEVPLAPSLPAPPKVGALPRKGGVSAMPDRAEGVNPSRWRMSCSPELALSRSPDLDPPPCEGLSALGAEALEKRLEASLSLVQAQFSEVRLLLREAAARGRAQSTRSERPRAEEPRQNDFSEF